MELPFDIEERKRLWECPQLKQSFPLRFEEGSEWQEITGYCAKCKKAIEADSFHGEVVSTFKGIFNVKAVGYCPNCQLVTCFHWNLKHDCISGKDPNGNWLTWDVKAETWMEKIKKFFKTL